MNTNSPIIRQAITTRFVPPTSFRPARIVAQCERGKSTFAWDDALNVDLNHVTAAKRLCARFAEEDSKEYGTAIAQSFWSRNFVTGATKKGYVHVFQS